MITVLIVGAGKSSTYLIDTLLKNTNKKSGTWNVIVADMDEKMLKYRTRNYPNAEIAVLDVTNSNQRQQLVKRADVVVSLMPAQLHYLLALDCLQYRKHLITSSYASEEMRALDSEVKKSGLMFMCEMGLDPGIDHMSANAMFDSIRKAVSSIKSFKSYCGGLVAPESDNNPWHYKFSWNPSNVIHAGKEGAMYLQNGKQIELDYDQVFSKTTDVFCENIGKFSAYANRDSLKYIDAYQIDEIESFVRATLRHPDFCKAWYILVKMGLTDNSNIIDTNNLSYKEFLTRLVEYNDTTISLQEFVWSKYHVKNATLQKMITWLNIFSEDPINQGETTPAQILMKILEQKWELKPEDKDMIVMQHEIEYIHKGVENKVISNMVVYGENAEFSAMAKTVGMPMAILTDLVVNQQLKLPTGICIPTMPEIYRPVLNRLKKFDIDFNEYFL
jgi:saccharopine dehydrogenase-like NADP-dependent oxidoreductase